MSIFAILSLSILILWTVYGIFGPRVKKSSRANHNAMGINFPIPYKGTSYGPGVWKQEEGEWRFSKVLGVIVGYIYWFLTMSYPIVVIAPIIAIAVDSFSRKFIVYDIAGHGAEILYAEKMGFSNYMEEEAERMSKDRNFKAKWSNDSTRKEIIIEQLKKYRWLSRIVLSLSYKKIPTD